MDIVYPKRAGGGETLLKNRECLQTCYPVISNLNEGPGKLQLSHIELVN